MRRLSSLTMPIWIKPSRARWLRSFATPGRPVSAPIDCMYRTAFTIVLRKNSTRAVNKLAVGDGLQADVAIGPLIDEKPYESPEHIADALEKAPASLRAVKRTNWAATSFNRPFWRMSLITRKSPKKRHSGRSRLCSASATRRMSSGRLTIPSSARQPILCTRFKPRFPRRRSAGIRHRRY